MRRALPLLLLLPLLAGTARAEEDEDAELRRLTRRQLLLRATASVDPANPAVGGLADIRTLTQKQRKEFEGEDGEVFERLDALVGTTGEPGTAQEGLIPQGARFYRWVTDQLLPSERHADPEAVKAWRAKQVQVRLDKAREEHERKAKEREERDKDPKAGDAPFDEEAARKRIREVVLALPVTGADGVEGGDARKPAFFLKPPDGPLIPLPAAPPADVAALPTDEREALVTALVTATIEIERAKDTGASGVVVALEGIDLLRGHAGIRPGPSRDDPTSWRFPLVQPDELAWMECKDFVGWRRLQVALRREAYADLAVPSLVSDADVEVRRARVEAFKSEKARVEARIAAVQAAFDHMADAESHWQREVGSLGFQIENKLSECENCSPEEETKLRRELAKKQLQERAAQQELRLLYVTAVRAKARLDLLDQSLAIANEELVLAEGSLQRYVDAQSRTRRETQLAELRLQAKDLKHHRAEFDAYARDEALTASEREVNATLREAAERMLALNERLTEVVRLRQTLEARAAGKSDVERGRVSPPPPPEEEIAPTKPAGDAKPAPQRVETPVDPLASLRDPHASELNPGYIQLAREKLDHPAFDATLVAAHHAAADDTLKALRSAIDKVEAADLGREEFNRTAAEIEERIGVHPRWRYWYVQQLGKMRASFADSVEAIGRKHTQIRERIGRLEVWKAELESLGVRSFAIRKNRSLGAGQLGEAGEDFAATWNRAVDWFGCEGSSHLGTFLQKRWIALLFLAGVVFASVLLVRYGRHWIDERLTRMAQRVPALRREPITVSAEAQEAKQQREAIEAARREAEEAALKGASGEGEKGAVRGSSGEAGEGG